MIRTRTRPLIVVIQTLSHNFLDTNGYKRTPVHTNKGNFTQPRESCFHCSGLQRDALRCNASSGTSTRCSAPLVVLLEGGKARVS
eukprot:1328283-Rhodomonas_salina.1